MTAIPTNNTLLTAANLNKTVQVGEQSLAIIKDVSIHVDAGEFVVIMGKSGSGKSTLLGLLAALDYPDSGSVKLGEQTLSSLDEDKLAAIRQREMGFVFQSFHLLPTLTVSENIAFPLDIARRPRRCPSPTESMNSSTRSDLGIGVIAYPINYPAVNSSVPPSPALWCRVPKSSLLMSQPVIWTSKMPTKLCSCYWIYGNKPVPRWWW